MKTAAALVALVLSLGALAGSIWLWRRLPRSSGLSWAAVQRQEAKSVEAKVAVTEIAWAIAQCAERSGALPPTSAKVPAADKVRAQMYQSRLSDWDDPAFVCAGFHMVRPQLFQYQWSRGEGETGGIVEADADFDGDGSVDHRTRLAVRCERAAGALRCRPDRMTTEPFAPVFATPEWWE